MEDRRSLDRFILEIPAKVVTAGAGKGRKAPVMKTRDISSGGAFIRTSKTFCKGARVQIEMVLALERFEEILGPKAQILLQVNGVIVRSEADGIAVRFEKSYQIQSLGHQQD